MRKVERRQQIRYPYEPSARARGYVSNRHRREDAARVAAEQAQRRQEARIFRRACLKWTACAIGVAVAILGWMCGVAATVLHNLPGGSH